VNGSYELDATTWSPVASLAADAKKPRGGPSFLFAAAVIGGVTLLTAGGVAAFFVVPSQSAPDEVSAVKPQASVAASLDPSQIPVRKVATRTIAVAAGADGRAADMSASGISAADTRAAGQTDAGVSAADRIAAAEEPGLEMLADAGDVDALEQQDPRWARVANGAAAFASVLQPAAGGDDAATGTISLAGPSPTAAKGLADGTRTAAIAPGEVKPRRAVEAKPGNAADDAADDDSGLPPGVTAQMRTVQLGRGVNMRSRPKSGSSVITVIPANATVQLAGCKVWCEIVYKGRRGYIYKDFVGAAASSAAQPAKAKTVFTVDSAQQSDPADKTKPSRLKVISSRAQ
jgi:hypothetical protein